MIRRGLVANGDPRNISTFSNIPHFFLKAGLQSGLLHSGVVLRPEELRTRRFIWNALRPLTLDRPRGWTYSRRYARTVWARREVAGEMEEYISHFQLLPPRNEVGKPVTYYIDATMRQWFEDYGWRVGRRVRSDSLAREREAYLSSRYVVCMSDWCAEDVVSSYGVPPEQVRTILPGANLDEGFTPTRGGVGRRAVAASAGPYRDRLGAKGRPRASRRRLDPRAHGIRRRSRRSRARSDVASQLIRLCGRLDTSTRVASSNDSWRSSGAFTSVACSLESRRPGSRRSSSFAWAYRSSRRPWEALSIPRAPACGFRSRLTENGSPRPSPRFFESPSAMRR